MAVCSSPRLQFVRLHSPALQVEKTYYIWLPPGYTAAGPRYPAVYLFRGHESEWVDPAADEHRGGRTVCARWPRP